MDASATLLSLALTPLVLAVKSVRDASANIRILEMRVFLQSSLFNECLSYFAQFGFEAVILACKK